MRPIPRLALRPRAFGLAAALLFVAASSAVRAQSLSLDRERSRTMLSNIEQQIKKNYYDPSFHGLDIEARFKAADDKLKEATSRGQMFGIIAQAVLDLKDSHTFFVPPQRAARTDYGWQVQMIGDDAYVIAVKPGSDAEKKGLKPGDRVLGVDEYGLTRDNLWIFQYLYYALRPRMGVNLEVQSPGAQQSRQLAVDSKITEGKIVTDLTGNDVWALIREEENEEHLMRHRYAELGDDLMIWKMPAFDLEKEKVIEVMSHARKHKALVIDLRGNGGGAEETLLQLIGCVSSKDVTVGELHRRKGNEPLVAKTHGADKAFTGQLIVLVDSRSGSAAELFARVVQLEKLGTVVGDRTAGKVMRSKEYPFQIGADTVVFYSASITDADVVMTDGKSLENVGVAPDKLMLPTGADLASGRDPVLAYAASLAGVKLDPEKAGALFPVEWKK
ncbi:MAG: S41 family peptidase [Acidobacteriota bacterium]|nr:S41 family peptidase [Acidobacteriota bacterium]